MPDKIRITITTVVEYEPEPENYEDCTTLEEMARVDLAAAKDDPMLFETMPGAVTDIKAETLEARPRTLQDAGYAPGLYLGRCLTCDQPFDGDKRAWTCRPCAEKAIAAEPEVLFLRSVAP
jgi:hypothetical protein